MVFLSFMERQRGGMEVSWLSLTSAGECVLLSPLWEDAHSVPKSGEKIATPIV